MPNLHKLPPDPLRPGPHIQPLATIMGEQCECMLCLGHAITPGGTHVFRISWGE